MANFQQPEKSFKNSINFTKVLENFKFQFPLHFTVQLKLTAQYHGISQVLKMTFSLIFCQNQSFTIAPQVF